MNAWHEGIYGNEDAQDFLNVLMDIYYESNDLAEFLSLAREHSFNRFADCRFVLADLEVEVDGQIDYYQDVLAMIEAELTSYGLSRWTNSDIREKVLNGFRASLAKRLEESCPDELLDFSAIPDWLQEKKYAEVFESTI